MSLFSTSIDHLASKTEVELVRAELATLRAEMTATRAEASELYEKAYHMHARVAKRLRDAQETPEPVETPTPQLVTDEVTERVLARRKNRGVSH